MSVTDRFLAELGPFASGQVPKDLDMKYENLIGGLKHIQIKVRGNQLLALHIQTHEFIGVATRSV